MAQVISPVTRRGSKVSGNIPGSSPGARSAPGNSSRMPDTKPDAGAPRSRSKGAHALINVKLTGPEG
jgi:hypothetical protein